MGRSPLSNMSLLMSYKVSARDVEKLIDRLDILPADDVEITAAQEVRVAAVQLMLKRYTSLSDYIIDMNLYVADAVNRRAKLVCFPQFAGLLPMSFHPRFQLLLEQVRPKDGATAPDADAAASGLSYLSDSIFEAYYHTMSLLAARHRVHIMAGSTLYYDKNTLRHRAFLFDTGGNLCGYQDKLSLTEFEQRLGVEQASEIKVFDTPVGLSALLTGSDADYYELARVAYNLGARVLLHPAAFSGEYTPVHATLGLNMRTQENRLWGVQSVMIGDTGLGFAAEGACCIFGPAELTRAKNGTIARSNGRFEPDILCIGLNNDHLTKIRNPYRQDFNVEFLEKYIDRLY